MKFYLSNSLFAALLLVVSALPCIVANEGWTDWYNHDGPSGSADYEGIITHQPYPCGGYTPVDIQCETVDGVDSLVSGDILYTPCDPELGLICLNQDNPNGGCSNYRVRYRCSDPPPSRWTQWYGDVEKLNLLNGWAPCGGDTPVDIECQTHYGTELTSTGESQTCTPEGGLICNNEGGCMHFYKVRYLCPSPSSPPSSPPTYSPGPEYRLTFDKCTFQEDQSTDVGDITCDFTAMGGKDHTVSSAVYAFEDCEEAAPTGISKDSGNGANLNDDLTVDTVWPFQEHSDYSVTISLASEAADNKQGDNKILFCLRTEVKDSTADVQYWEARKIEFDVKIQGDFTTAEELTTSFYDGIEQTVEDVGDYEFGVTAFRCDSSGAAVGDADKELALGENFFLCVEGEQDNVRITSIQTLKANKNGYPELQLIDGMNPQNQNTYVYGEGDEKVVIATRLTAEFFEDGESVTLSGVANLETGQRRQLSIRNMQAADAEGSGFSMEVGIVPSNGSGASAFKATIAVFAAAVVALFV